MVQSSTTLGTGRARHNAGLRGGGVKSGEKGCLKEHTSAKISEIKTLCREEERPIPSVAKGGGKEGKPLCPQH